MLYNNAWTLTIGRAKVGFIIGMFMFRVKTKQLLFRFRLIIIYPYNFFNVAEHHYNLPQR